MSNSLNYDIDTSLLELFKIEVENHTRSLETGLVAVETDQSPERIEPLMRAAHSIKGAARIVGLDIAVELAHAMEDVLSSAQHGKYTIDTFDIDVLLKGNDIFISIIDCDVSEMASRLQAKAGEIQDLSKIIREILTTPKSQKSSPTPQAPAAKPEIAESDEVEEIEEIPDIKAEKPVFPVVDISLMELFVSEVAANSENIELCLLNLDTKQKAERAELLMRSAHSIKGASRIVGLDPCVRLAGIMEEIFSYLQQSKYALNENDTDTLLRSNDVFAGIAQIPVEDITNMIAEEASIIDTFVKELEILHEYKKSNAVEQEEAILDTEIDDENLEEFRTEVKSQLDVIQTGIVKIDSDMKPVSIVPFLRAIRKVRGAAATVGFSDVVGLAQTIEKIITVADDGLIHLNAEQIDKLKIYAEIFRSLIGENALETLAGLDSQSDEIATICSNIRHFLSGSKKISELKPEIKSNGTKSENPQLSQPDFQRTKRTLGVFASNKPKPVVKSAKEIAQVKKEADISKSIKPEVRKTTEEPPVQENKELTQQAPNTQTKVTPSAKSEAKQEKTEESFVRVLSENLNRLLGLAGECLVQAKSMKQFSGNLLRIKKLLLEIDSFKETIFQNLKDDNLTEEMRDKFVQSSEKLDQMRDLIVQVIEQFEMYSRRLEYTTERLYTEAIATRMKPFSEGLHGFPRLVRDISKKLDKRVNLIIKGESTRVDRDILEKLESPLNHLVRNAIDHGLETPDERIAAGKNPEGTVIIEARHSFGMLIISIKDDGRGVDTEKLRKKIVEKGYTTEEMAANMSNTELMEFLFLPGFSTAKQVTEISGRGVGLDVVFSMVHEVGGTIRADSVLGTGTTFQLQLPLTLSVLRTLLMEINGEPYAIPLSRLDRIQIITQKDLKIIEDRQYCIYDNDNIGIIDAYQVFRLPGKLQENNYYHIVVISDRLNRYGLVVDKFLGERDLVVIPLDPRLGDIQNISAGAILEDGSPVLILDIDDVVRSIDNILSKDRIKKIGAELRQEKKKKHILVVDDSLTVREVERKLLENKGYNVTVAVDGVDGWNVLQQNLSFDMVISDIDMPRMNGIDLVKKIKFESRYKQLPVMIVSYKDRDEDRMAGLEAGANYYLTKSSFHDATLLNAVRDLIGEP